MSKGTNFNYTNSRDRNDNRIYDSIDDKLTTMIAATATAQADITKDKTVSTASSLSAIPAYGTVNINSTASIFTMGANDIGKTYSVVNTAGSTSVLRLASGVTFAGGSNRQVVFTTNGECVSIQNVSSSISALVGKSSTAITLATT